MLMEFNIPHSDNPKDYAKDLTEDGDAKKFLRLLRGPVDEEVELAIDEQTGMKNYIANERLGLNTSASFVRKVLGKSIQVRKTLN